MDLAPSGFPDRRWSDGEAYDSPDADAFLRLSRAVCDRYSEALPALAVTHRTSHLRLFLVGPDDDRVATPGLGDPPAAWFVPGFRGGFEMGLRRLPPRWRERDDARRREDVLAAVHASAGLMADTLRLDGRERLAAAADHVRAHDYGYSWEGPWLRSPRRGPFAARVAYRLQDDGFGRLHVEVAVVDRDGVPTASARTVERPSWTSGSGARRSARTLRWVAPGLLSVDVGAAALHDPNGTLAVEVTAGPDGVPRLVETLGAPLPVPPSRTLTDRALAIPVPPDADAQARLAASKKVADRLSAAMDGRTLPQIVEELAGDTSAKVRQAVAARPTAPPELLARLADDPDRTVRAKVAAHPAADAATLLRLAADPAWQVFYEAVGRDDLAPALMATLVHEGTDRVREFLARRPDLPTDSSLVLARDPVPAVRIALAGSLGLSDAAHTILKTDPNRTVRATLRSRESYFRL